MSSVITLEKMPSPFASDGFGKIGFFYKENVDSNLVIDRGALSMLLIDMDRYHETQGFLVGKHQSNGKIHFEKYVPGKGLLRGYRVVTQPAKPRHVQYTRFLREGFDSVIDIHLHPPIGEVNVRLPHAPDAIALGDIISYSDRVHGAWAHLDGKYFGLNTVLTGVLSKIALIDGKKTGKGAYLAVFEGTGGVNVGGFLLDGVPNQSPRPRIAHLLRLTGQKFTTAVNHMKNGDVLLQAIYLREEDVATAWDETKRMLSEFTYDQRRVVPVTISGNVIHIPLDSSLPWDTFKKASELFRAIDEKYGTGPK